MVIVVCNYVKARDSAIGGSRAVVTERGRDGARPSGTNA